MRIPQAGHRIAAHQANEKTSVAWFDSMSAATLVTVAFAFGVIQMSRLLACTKERPWPYWVASVVALIVIGFLIVLLVRHMM